MKIKIHRPAQIGGCITEIATATSRIIIDLGHNLPSAGDEPDNFDNADIIRCLTKIAMPYFTPITMETT